MMLIKTLKSHSGFIYPYLAYLVVGGIFLLNVNRAESHEILNQFFWAPLHPFFAYITHLGDGLTLAIVAAILLMLNFRATIFMALSGMLAGGITQFLKHQFFDDVVRPVFYFNHFHPGEFMPQVVPGVQTLIHNSFPSGHSTASFAMFCTLAMITRRPSFRVIFFFAALIIAYSRVYLSQHFFVDTYVGSFIGISGTLIIYHLLQWLENRYSIQWWYKSLINR
ncbi:phosphatase PAP2 family protein [bacterium SCSIO 12741]|nr:phosphatase PAP2 family protein [bacterium SCSIO 12741]